MRVAALPESLLVVMTDGKNEVGKGDDAGLLDGAAGLQEAANATRSSGVQVIAVGFGDRGSIDESAYDRSAQRRSWLTASRSWHRLSTSRAPAYQSYCRDVRIAMGRSRLLQGRTLQVKATLNVSGKKFESDERQWSAPQIGTPSFDGKCDTAELKAALPTPLPKLAFAAAPGSCFPRPGNNAVSSLVLGAAVGLAGAVHRQLPWLCARRRNALGQHVARTVFQSGQAYAAGASGFEDKRAARSHLSCR
jgi:hypothetical protein